MIGTGPQLRQGGHVLPRGIALVPGEAVLGTVTVQLHHVAIAGDLGEDRGGCDRHAPRVSANQGPVRARKPRDRQAVDERAARGEAKLGESPRHAGVRGTEDIHPVDLLRLHQRYRPALGDGDDAPVEIFPLRLVQALRISQSLQLDPAG